MRSRHEDVFCLKTIVRFGEQLVVAKEEEIVERRDLVLVERVEVLQK